MSRTYHKPVCKDKGMRSKVYNRHIRRAQNNSIRTFIMNNSDYTDLDVPDKRVIINDYVRCDYVFGRRDLNRWRKKHKARRRQDS